MAGAACHYCGAALDAEAPDGPDVDGPRDGIDVAGTHAGPTASGHEDEPQEAPQEPVPGDLPPAQEARRVRGWAVPLVAAAVVLGVGCPLTALAVSQANRLPVVSGDEPASELDGTSPGSEAPGQKGRARLTGALTYDGPALPLGCSVGIPRVVTLESGADRFSILLSVPEGAIPGAYQVETPSTFVAVSRLVGGTQTWTSLGRTSATGRVVLNADRSVTAEFRGLEASGGGAEGTLDGTVEVHCA